MSKAFKILVFVTAIGAARAGPAQQIGGCNSGATPQCRDGQVIRVSGTSINVTGNGGLSASFEEVIAGSPATVSIVIAGCGDAGTCITLDTNAVVANSLRNPAIAQPYAYYTVMASWTGGSGVSVTVNTRETIAALQGSGSSGLPSGAYVFIKTGTCPTGFTEDDSLASYGIVVTSTAAGDVGSTGGSNSYTPAGTVTAPTVASLIAAAQTFTGSATTVPAETVDSLTAAAQIFTGSLDTTSATSGGTPAGTNGATATSGNCASTNIAAGSGSTTACKATAPNLTVPAETFTGSSLATHTHTVTPTGTNATSAVTGTLNGTTIEPLGANAPSDVSGSLNAPEFSGTPATIAPPYFKMIACEKK